LKVQEVLGIILARGGSKGIPRKNIKLLGDHPLVAYTVASGLASKKITKLIVSSDDQEIIDIATRYGAEAPFVRPRELALDDTTDLPVIKHALDFLFKSEKYSPEMIVHLRPTTPFRPCGMIDQGIQLLNENPSADCVRSVSPPGENPFKMYKKSREGFLTPLIDLPGIREAYNQPRQNLPEVFWHTGHLDVIRSKTIIDFNSLSGNQMLSQDIESKYRIDIDMPADFEFADSVLKNRNLNIDFPSGSGH
jgi:CMP-N-acetylneuraminic acid synthetase